MTTPYVDQGLRHSGSAEVMYSGMFDEPPGTIAKSLPRALCNLGSLAFNATGQPSVRLLPLPAGALITNLAWVSGATAQAGGTHAWWALMDQYSNVLAVTADNTGATFVTASTYFKAPATIPYLVPQTGPYYFVVSVSAGTTMPTMAGAANVGGGLNAAAGSGALNIYGVVPVQAAPPAVGQNLGAITAANGVNYECYALAS